MLQPPALDVDCISKQFDSVQAVGGVSFSA